MKFLNGFQTTRLMNEAGDGDTGGGGVSTNQGTNSTQETNPDIIAIQNNDDLFDWQKEEAIAKLKEGKDGKVQKLAELDEEDLFEHEKELLEKDENEEEEEVDDEDDEDSTDESKTLEYEKVKDQVVKFKVDGKEVSSSIGELIKNNQLASVSYKKMQEANEVKRNGMAILEAINEGPQGIWNLLTYMNKGNEDAAMQVVEEILSQRLQYLKMTPEAKKALEAERKAKIAEAQAQHEAADKETAKYQLHFQTIREEIMDSLDIFSAPKELRDLGKQLIVQIIRNKLEAGKMVDKAEQIQGEVEQYWKKILEKHKLKTATPPTKKQGDTTPPPATKKPTLPHKRTTDAPKSQISPKEAKSLREKFANVKFDDF